MLEWLSPNRSRRYIAAWMSQPIGTKALAANSSLIFKSHCAIVGRVLTFPCAGLVARRTSGLLLSYLPGR
jgi:hypothetical protein